MLIEKQLPYKYQIYEIIKNDIIGGKYKAGDELNERTLSETMGVSRTPVREAIQMLQHDGWVVMETYKGAVIRSFDQKYLNELMRVRMALELTAVEDAAANLSQESLEEIEQAYRRQEEAADSDRTPGFQFIQLDRAFHQAIYRLSGNRTLIGLLDNLNDMICVAGVRALGSDVRRQETMAEHLAILQSLRQRDASAAVLAMRRHMELTAMNVRQHADMT